METFVTMIIPLQDDTRVYFTFLYSGDTEEAGRTNHPSHVTQLKCKNSTLHLRTRRFSKITVHV